MGSAGAGLGDPHAGARATFTARVERRLERGDRVARGAAVAVAGVRVDRPVGGQAENARRQAGDELADARAVRRAREVAAELAEQQVMFAARGGELTGHRLCELRVLR